MYAECFHRVFLDLDATPREHHPALSNLVQNCKIRCKALE